MYANYENLAAEVLAYAVKDYKNLKEKLKKTKREAEINKINFELKSIEKFLLSEKFNFTEISGNNLLALAKEME